MMDITKADRMEQSALESLRRGDFAEYDRKMSDVNRPAPQMVPATYGWGRMR